MISTKYYYLEYLNCVELKSIDLFKGKNTHERISHENVKNAEHTVLDPMTRINKIYFSLKNKDFTVNTITFLGGEKKHSDIWIFSHSNGWMKQTEDIYRGPNSQIVICALTAFCCEMEKYHGRIDNIILCGIERCDYDSSLVTMHTRNKNPYISNRLSTHNEKIPASFKRILAYK